jgi:protein-tyrosine phosphatase
MRVLMVCLGNICRSPMAEGVLWNIAQKRKLRLEVDSAGTANYHIGESPDHRAIRCMKEYGIDISRLRGRQFNKHDFESFDHILVMDQSNLRNVLALAENDLQRSKVKLMLSYSSISEELDVPDPWYGDMKDFHKVYAMLTEAVEGFLGANQRGEVES